jgi:hypothetical protein
LVSSYNHYYQGVRSQINRDIQKLLRIRSAIKHPDTIHTINEMLNERAGQLALDPLKLEPESVREVS